MILGLPVLTAKTFVPVDRVQLASCTVSPKTRCPIVLTPFIVIVRAAVMFSVLKSATASTLVAMALPCQLVAPPQAPPARLVQVPLLPPPPPTVRVTLVGFRLRVTPG